MPNTAIHELWTVGIWMAKPGCAEAFREAWQSFAEWTSLNQAGASEAFLLRDAQDPNRHISFGPWRSEDDISGWRGTPEFTAFVGRVRELCDEFQPNTLHQVGHVAGARTS
jgi:quinol monooxygenase YgiN